MVKGSAVTQFVDMRGTRSIVFVRYTIGHKSLHFTIHKKQSVRNDFEKLNFSSKVGQFFKIQCAVAAKMRKVRICFLKTRFYEILNNEYYI